MKLLLSLIEVNYTHLSFDSTINNDHVLEHSPSTF